MLNFEFDMDHEYEYFEYVGTDYVCAWISLDSRDIWRVVHRYGL